MNTALSELSDPMIANLADLIAAKLTIKPISNTMPFGELFNLYYEKRVKARLKNHQNAFYFFKVHGPRWQDVQIHEISRADVQDWIDQLGRKSHSSAKRALDMMRAIINWGIKRDVLPPMNNPCNGVESFSLTARERFMVPSELAKLDASLAHESPSLRDFFRLSLLTGARRGNLLAMRWSEIDFDLASWSIPGEKYKNGSTHVIPLSTWALGILERRRELVGNSPWVFPGRQPGEHLHEPKRAWKRVLIRAGLEDLHIHDLRRTLASYMAIKGESPYVIAKMLGHKDIRSTAVYARLDLGAVRSAAEAVSEQWQVLIAIPILSEMKQLEPAKENCLPLIAKPRKNASSRVTGTDQILVEGKIITVLRTGGSTKTHFYSKIGGRIRVNSRELDRILNEMEVRQIIRRYQDDQGYCRFAMFESQARAV